MRRFLRIIPLLSLYLPTAHAASLLDATLLTMQSPAIPPDTYILDHKLKRLDTGATESLSRYQGKPVVLMFFQPECTWCLKQVRALNAFQQLCGDAYRTVGIGFNGSRIQLQRELDRLQPSFPTYEISPDIEMLTGGMQTTPFTFLTDSDGNYVSWALGFVEQERLPRLLNINAEDCSAG